MKKPASEPLEAAGGRLLIGNSERQNASSAMERMAAVSR